MTSLHNISKSFGTTKALEGVSLEFRAGEILAVVGENGAGKTTLMRIAAGEENPDSGEVSREGSIALVHQHFMLVAELSIAANLALADPRGLGLTSRRRIADAARATIAESGIGLEGVERLVSSLSVGEKSRLELIKAIAKRPATLILDEPTSVLTPAESEQLFTVMRRLAANGTGVVFISHKLPEVLSVADRIAVMRQGRVVESRATGETTAHELARAMIGDRSTWPVSRHDSGVVTPPIPSGPTELKTVLKMENVAGEILAGVDLTVTKGEIVAIVGVAGNGQAELAAILRGLTRPRQGRFVIEGSRDGHIPEDRTRDGIVGQMTLAENLALGGRRWNRTLASDHAQKMIDLYSIRSTGANQRAGDLSGGNQQKVVLARELHLQPSLIVAAEPSRGLDIEATAFVHGQLRAAAAAGAAILLITSDLDEAFGLASAIHVIYRGKLSQRLSPDQAAGRVPDLMMGVG